MSARESLTASLPSPSSDAGVLLCSASKWEGDTSLCRWCNGELPKRRTRWCSDDCSWSFTRNHMWSSASRAARKRDGDMCVECRMYPRDARDKALADHLQPAQARRYLVLQVHHKTPVLGQHGVFGCHHHLDGLETVCLHHHLERHHGDQNAQLAIEAA
jgi:hypothetical protein